ncbi:hypothetical protein Bbelb_100810 [Branchiostoma belcheri]|nr:hypothetical protein Bbelb_100810 [Branchiostoma belcheri]
MSRQSVPSSSRVPDNVERQKRATITIDFPGLTFEGSWIFAVYNGAGQTLEGTISFVTTELCDPADCNGNGACVSGSCRCFNGWQGSGCNTAFRPCPADCSGQGTCNNVTGQCDCRTPYKGVDCSQTGAAEDVCVFQDGQGSDVNSLTATLETVTVVVSVSTGVAPVRPAGKEKLVKKEPAFRLTAMEMAPARKEPVEYRRCPSDCSGSGVCNNVTGICSCERLSTGLDCSEISETNCADNLDDDGDLLVDCDDPDCCNDTSCVDDPACLSAPALEQLAAADTNITQAAGRSFYDQVKFLFQNGSVQEDVSPDAIDNE